MNHFLNDTLSAVSHYHGLKKAFKSVRQESKHKIILKLKILQIAASATKILKIQKSEVGNKTNTLFKNFEVFNNYAINEFQIL